MSIIQLSYPLQEPGKKNIALALGFFDGIHLGHQEVIHTVKRLAKQLNIPPAIMTFQPHPSEVVRLASISQYLTPLREKIIQFRRFGLDEIYIIQFDLKLAQLSKDDFVDQVLIPLGVKGVVTGFNFTFGKNALGRAEDLQRLGKNRFVTHIVKPVCVNGQVISSTYTRSALVDGRMEEVTQMLGRSYIIEGKVVSGDRRGRKIGFPTANLSLTQPFFIPLHGVYVVRVKVGNKYVPGIMNIGVRPTFSQSVERIEVHLLDYNENLYGRTLRVEVLHYIRTERKFSSVQELSNQIFVDIQYTKDWLSTAVPHR